MIDSNESILQLVNIDSSGRNLLESSGKWAKFIGITYLTMAGLLLVITVLLFANLDLIANAFMNVNGMSQASLDFMMGAGKWLFVLVTLLSFCVMFLNGYFLVKFGISSKNYSHTYNESALSYSFIFLSRYLILTTVLSVVSTVSSVLAFLYFI